MSQPVARAARPPAGEIEPIEDRAGLRERFARVRAFTGELTDALAPEDTVLQAMADVSPSKWHLAHTTWFFERFVLQEHVSGYEAHDPDFGFLFNSYYNAVGPMHPRAERGRLSRPTLAEILLYRASVDARLADFLADCDELAFARAAPLVRLGCEHERQHQELILTDLQFNLFQNPLHPAVYPAGESADAGPAPASVWIRGADGVLEIGAGDSGFSFDNERPRHRELIHPHALASRPVSNAEYLAFIADGGYERPEFWLDAGIATARERGWRHPLYWFEREGCWWRYTLAGPLPLAEAEPVCHVSFFEADAFARWAGERLPTEAEWEIAAAAQPVAGNFADSRRYRPRPAPAGGGLQQLFGDVWEWTASAYLGYPGYRAPAGAVGEYNGKFMCNQFVLRGGSCATSQDQVRASYRNFFPPDARWQFSGIRLASDA